MVSNFWKVQAVGRFALARFAAGRATICISFEKLWAIIEAKVKTWFAPSLLQGIKLRAVSFLACPNNNSCDPRPLWNSTIASADSFLLVTYYAGQEVNNYSYLFSLDIPSSIKYLELNKVDVIYEFNKRALLKLRGLIEIHPELKDKIYFVWHFKIAAQYQIWSRLYKELGLAEFISNRAIGGMVGLHGKTKTNFSPFTAISYRCLLDYLEAENFKNDFRLHFLGMYIGYDRFQIALLEKLFSRYLQDSANVKMSYDSINPRFPFLKSINIL